MIDKGSLICEFEAFFMPFWKFLKMENADGLALLMSILSTNWEQKLLLKYS